MKASMIKSFATRVVMAFALVLTSFTNTFASAWPELLDKRTHDGPSTSLYVVIFTVIIIAIIIAITTSREREGTAEGKH